MGGGEEFPLVVGQYAEALRDVLRGLAVDDPSTTTWDEFIDCFFCHGPEESTAFELLPEDHEADCPWVAARTILGLPLDVYRKED